MEREMERNIISGMNVFFLILFFLVLLINNINIVNAQKIGIHVNPIENDEASFSIVLYDDNNKKVNAQVEYVIQDYYTEEAGKGSIDSREQIRFRFPKNPVQGLWKITVSYNGKSASELFNVGDIKRADIRIEGDNLILENTGNVPYDRKILIMIGDKDQAAQVHLNVMQTKQIKLTAPEGEYTIKVNDGSQKKEIVFSGISLTGNVIGLENVSQKSFLQKYPVVSLFLASLLLAALVVSGLRFKKRYSERAK